MLVDSPKKIWDPERDSESVAPPREQDKPGDTTEATSSADSEKQEKWQEIVGLFENLKKLERYFSHDSEDISGLKRCFYNLLETGLLPYDYRQHGVISEINAQITETIVRALEIFPQIDSVRNGYFGESAMNKVLADKENAYRELQNIEYATEQMYAEFTKLISDIDPQLAQFVFWVRQNEGVMGWETAGEISKLSSEISTIISQELWKRMKEINDLVKYAKQKVEDFIRAY